MKIMGTHSADWLANLCRCRYYDIDDTRKGRALPIVPWLHPPLGREFQNLILNLGVERTIRKGERFYSDTERVAHICLVTSGVTARNFGHFAPQCKKAAAVSVPGHIACGNLNFFTSRPAFGHYFALTNAKVVFCPQTLFLSVLRRDAALYEKFNRHLECCSLSDRIGLAAMAFLPVELRMKSFVVSWALHYGRTFHRDEGLWMRMPVPLTRTTRSLLANTSSISTDKVLKKWKEAGIWSREGDWIDFPVLPFEEAWRWMREAEEPSLYQWPATMEEFLLELEAEEHKDAI